MGRQGTDTRPKQAEARGTTPPHTHTHTNRPMLTWLRAILRLWVAPLEGRMQLAVLYLLNDAFSLARFYLCSKQAHLTVRCSVFIFNCPGHGV